MSTNHDDPRLTAYALGELNAADRAAIEQQIGESVETLLEIEAIREVAGQLRAALREEGQTGMTTKVTRSVSEGATEQPHLPLVIKPPTLASVANDAAPRRKASGKFAVAASCLALACAFGIVMVTGHHERQHARNLTRRSHGLEWYDLDGTVVMSERSGHRAETDSLGVELRLETAPRNYGFESESLRSDVFSEAGGGIAAPTTSFGLGGFDVTSLGRGPAVRDSNGNGVLDREGFGGRGSGSRPSMSASGGGTAAPGAPIKKGQKSVAVFDRAGPTASPPVNRLSVAEAQQQASRFRTPTFAGGLLEGGRGLPKDVAFGEAKQLREFAENTEAKSRGEVEARLKRREDRFGVTDSLAGEVLATKDGKSSGVPTVEVSVGSDDGLAVGDRLQVIRFGAGNAPQKFLGDVRIVFVVSDRAVGELVGRRELGVIQKGDRVVLKHDETTTAEAYAAIHDNPFATPLQEPLSTFSIDVDTASYSNMRRFLTQGSWPPADSVRIEELVNYFSYDYTPPNVEHAARVLREGDGQASRLPHDAPFAVHMEVAGCPWNADHRLVRVGLKGKEIALDKRPVSNLVFLIDVSGSMQPENRLPLVKAGLRRLVDQLGENDRVGIVVYAGASGLALDSTNATQKDVILSSLENLQAGGSTNGGEGIQLAYALARKHFIPKGTNRVILCTDGDFNVGVTNQDDLTRLIEEESKSGVFLSVLGFGMGNLKDSTLEKLADKGNGNYAYIDTLREANKVFVEQMTGTLITIAKDVKIQIEFNPSQVGAYRLIGYENRMLAAQDFHDDTKDAGEIGAGHTVTALYEIIPPNKLPAPTPVTEEKLKYQPAKGSGVISPSPKLDPTANLELPRREKDSRSRDASNELLTIKLRYKQPDADKSSLIEMPLTDAGRSFGQASTDFRFAASVASFGMILRHSPHRGNATLDAVVELAQSSLGADKSGYRSEFVSLVRSAKALAK